VLPSVVGFDLRKETNAATIIESRAVVYGAPPESDAEAKLVCEQPHLHLSIRSDSDAGFTSSEPHKGKRHDDGKSD